MVAILQARRNFSLQRSFVLQLKSFFVFFVFCFVSINTLSAQKLSSITALDSAKLEYKIGQIDKALAFLDQAEQINVSRQIRAEIYLYKARIYSLQLNSFMAEEYVNKFLVLRPFQQFDADEFSEITQTAEKAKISPRMSIGVSLGLNSSAPVVTQSQSLILSTKESTVSNRTVYYDNIFAMNMEYYFRRNWSIFVELNATQYNLLRSSYTAGLDSNRLFIQFSVTQIPIAFRFDLIPVYFYSKYKPLSVSLAAGVFFNHLNRASAYPGGTEDYKTRIGAVNAIDYFNIFTYGVWTELSAAYRIKRLKFSLKLRYFSILNYMNEPDDKYSIGTGDEIIFNNYQLIDDFSFNSFSINVGVNYYLRYKIFKDIIKHKPKEISK